MSDKNRVIAKLTIEQFIADDGDVLVYVDSDDLNGGRIPLVTALGMLQLAIFSINNYPLTEDGEQ